MKGIFKVALIITGVTVLAISSYVIYRNQTLEYIVSQTEKAVFFVTTFKDGVPYKTGSGFFVKSDFSSDEAVYGVTNIHVIKGSDSVIITTNNHKSFHLTQVSYYSENCDLFIFRWRLADIELNQLRCLAIEDNEIEKSQFVFAVSHPQGFDYSFSSGNVASLRDFDKYGEIVQSTVPISAGSSGSPLLSKKGRVIGVNTFSYVDGQNLNFAVRLNGSTFSKLVNWENREYGELLFNLAHSLQIGEQIWMDINLNVNHFQNGDIILEARTAEEWELASKEGRPIWAYPRSFEHGASSPLTEIEDTNVVLSKDYGKLYNWYAVADPRGLAPVGWRIPTISDWAILVEKLGGGHFKTTKMLKSKTEWVYYPIDEMWGYFRNENTNESGINAYPSGHIYAGGRTIGIGREAGFWTLTEADNKNYYYVFELNSTISTFDTQKRLVRSPRMDIIARYNGEGYSVRCIK